MDALSIAMGRYSCALYTETPDDAIVSVESVLRSAMEEVQKPIHDAGPLLI